MERLMRAWRRLFGCRVCHRTGVVMVRECTCGAPSWSLEPHEAYCGAEPCPYRCPVAESRDGALSVWGRYLR